MAPNGIKIPPSDSRTVLGVAQLAAWSEERLPWQRRMVLSDAAVLRRERPAYIATRVEALLAALPGLDLPPSPEYEF